MRDRRIDLIRGVAILLITITHTVPSRSFLEKHEHFHPVTGFLFNGADLFIALSGLVCGMVYVRTYENNGLKATTKKAWGRVLQLLFFNALALLLVTAIVLSFNAAGVVASEHNLGRNPAEAVFETLTLTSPIPYFNILGLYVLLLVVLPLVVHLQQNGWRPIIVSALIYVAYAAYRFIYPGGPPPLADRFFVSPFAWQFLFLWFAAIGMSLDKIRAGLPRLGRALPFILGYFFVMYFLRSEDWIYHRFAGKFDLGFLRIVDLALVLYVIDQTVRPDLGERHPLGRAVASVGSNTLFLFCVSLVLCYFSSNLLQAIDGGRAAYLLVIIAEVLIVVGLGHLLLVNDQVRTLARAEWIQRLVDPKPVTARVRS